ncbi:c-type cytochrome [Maricurvus nonylphenolicus]|uniref:c-type cytochrome n=1 Tax=Maricurvus nonylphenolicus TaxID=1008307 RepID=UPI0036F3D2BC
MSRLLVIWLSVLTAVTVYADDRRAKVNYQLHCQGCHTGDGSGHPGRQIPTLTNYMGKFLTVEGGREFLIQVPGAAQSQLNDIELAELTNWMLKSFDPETAKKGFEPYSATEVGQLRKSMVLDFTGTREALVKKIEIANNY